MTVDRERGEILLEFVAADLAPPRRAAPLLREVTLSLARGEVGVILGPNGSGKTTLLRSAAGMWPARGGSVTYPPEIDRRPGVALLIEDPAAQFVARSVRGEIAFALENLGWDEGAIRARSAETLARLRLEDLADRDPGSLSPGEQQRALLAAALAPGPDLLLLDDPFLYMGAREGSEAWGETVKAVRGGLVGGALVAAQDAETATEADRVGFLEGGRLTAWGDPASVFRLPTPKGVEPPLGRWLEERLAAAGWVLAGEGYSAPRFLDRLRGGEER